MTVSSFYIGKYEVTQGEYEEIMGSLPSSCSSKYRLGDNYPVYYVTWYYAVAFYNALSKQKGYNNVYTISGTSVSADFTKNGGGQKRSGPVISVHYGRKLSCKEAGSGSCKQLPENNKKRGERICYCSLHKLKESLNIAGERKKV